MWDTRLSPILMAQSFRKLRERFATRDSTMMWSELEQYIKEAFDEIARLRLGVEAMENEVNRVESNLLLMREKK